jgi:integrase
MAIDHEGRKCPSSGHLVANLLYFGGHFTLYLRETTMSTEEQGKRRSTGNRRRTWGRGTIEQRGPDKWVVRLSHHRDPTTGKRVRDSRTVRGSRRDAERVLAGLVQGRDTHGPTPSTSGRLTLDAWIRQHIATADLSPRTRRDQLDLWARHSSPALRATALRDLTTAALDAYIAGLRERVSEHTARKLAPRTVQMFFNVIRAALNAAVRKRVLPANPAAGVIVKGGTATSKVGQALTVEEMNRFLAHDPESRLHALWVTAAYTGLRPAEVLALRWEDIDFDAAVLHVGRTLVRVGNEPFYGPCKAGSERAVELEPELVDALRRHRKRQLEERLQMGQRWIDERLVFTNQVGGALDQHNVANAFRARLKAAGLRKVRWYDLRHSYGTALIAAGVDAKTVSQLMGHRNVTLTLTHYTHPDAAARRAAVARLPWQRTATAGPTG